MGSHSVTCHPTQVNAPRLTTAMQAGTRFTYPGGVEGWVDLVDLIAPRPGVETATFRSRVRRRTAAPPRQPCIATMNDTMSATRKFQLQLISCHLLIFIFNRLTAKARSLWAWSGAPTSTQLNSSLLKMVAGWLKEYRIQYTKTNQMINVNEI